MTGWRGRRPDGDEGEVIRMRAAAWHQESDRPDGLSNNHSVWLKEFNKSFTSGPAKQRILMIDLWLLPPDFSVIDGAEL